ncbi:MAG: F0F1 ATP synthase subunit B [Bacteroidales bacterium]|nr:F0F1 ATP synthase subunit B [Bacteroidales bacterium]MBR6330175.1 F0F1 ATP synthase subunit B [Bacteroidales bacterium]
MNNPLVSPGLGVIVWMVIAFGILAFILIKWGWPVILKALDDREKTINESLNAAEKVRAEMAQLQAHNEDLLKQAKLERDEMLRNARLTSEQIIEEARQKATIEADRIVENARENINYEKLKAMHELKNQIATLSIDIAEKLIKEELADPQRANEIVSRQIENIHLN